MVREILSPFNEAEIATAVQQEGEQLIAQIPEHVTRADSEILIGNLRTLPLPLRMQMTLWQRSRQERKADSKKIAGGLFEIMSFWHVRRFLPKIYNPAQTSAFYNLLIKTVDRHSKIVDYPYGTSSVTHDIGTSDGIVVTRYGTIPKVIACFEYSTDNKTLDRRIRDGLSRFHWYQNAFPSNFSHARFVLMTPVSTPTYAIDIPAEVIVRPVPLESWKLSEYVKQIVATGSVFPPAVTG